ncbi:Nitrogen assimilation transcription factor nit-4 [Choanephora cucurbitarum]|uniref:Nitrogen assimilation transcription factor nit-4 n=1 Tax=Choanephora cucurbitarum TaxID=101091 RepID=A0A1C7NQ30_9FUNG|nr:Nitrogen assimilation transcription factor nit-4 [Choanephora cucurbitarum]
MAKATLELKYKRLKVGHACYVCRSKKIKCDGLRPSRGRTCESSSIPSESESQDSSTIIDEQLGASTESDDDSILFSRTPKNSTTDDISATSSIADDNWSIDTKKCTSDQCSADLFSTFNQSPLTNSIQWKDDPALPLKYSCPIEMPSSDIQLQMIELFFQKRYCTTPIIPKKLFYDQLNSKGPMITPLLLNAIYCDVSSFASASELPDVPKPTVFFNRAKRLIDDFLDKPRVSTIIALSLLSRYEPRPSKSKLMAAQNSRTWMYSGMAFRMCLELGLNIDTPESCGMLSEEEIELRRRVFWFCYCLDKQQSLGKERTWSLSSSVVKTQLPFVLSNDRHDQENKHVIDYFRQHIKLMTIGEQVLRLRVLHPATDNSLNSLFAEQAVQLKLEVMQWSTNSSSEIDHVIQKGTSESSIEDSEHLSLKAILRLSYCILLSKILECAPKNRSILMEQRVNASEIVQQVEILCNDYSKVTQFEQLVYALMTAVLVHDGFLNDSDFQIAQQSQHFQNRCSALLKKIQKHVSIPECVTVLHHISVRNQQIGHNNNATSTAAQAIDNDNLSDLLSSSPSTTHTQSLPSPEHTSSDQFISQSIYSSDLLNDEITFKQLNTMFAIPPPALPIWNEPTQCLDEYPLSTSPSDMISFSYPSAALASNNDCSQLPNYTYNNYQHHSNPSPLFIDPIVHMSPSVYPSQESAIPFVQSEQPLVYSLNSVPSQPLMPQFVYYP